MRASEKWRGDCLHIRHWLMYFSKRMDLQEAVSYLQLLETGHRGPQAGEPAWFRNHPLWRRLSSKNSSCLWRCHLWWQFILQHPNCAMVLPPRPLLVEIVEMCEVWLIGTNKWWHYVGTKPKTQHTKHKTQHTQRYDDRDGPLHLVNDRMQTILQRTLSHPWKNKRPTAVYRGELRRETWSRGLPNGVDHLSINTTNWWQYGRGKLLFVRHLPGSESLLNVNLQHSEWRHEMSSKKMSVHQYPGDLPTMISMVCSHSFALVSCYEQLCA